MIFGLTVIGQQAWGNSIHLCILKHLWINPEEFNFSWIIIHFVFEKPKQNKTLEPRHVITNF